MTSQGNKRKIRVAQLFFERGRKSQKQKHFCGPSGLSPFDKKGLEL